MGSRMSRISALPTFCFTTILASCVQHAHAADIIPQQEYDKYISKSRLVSGFDGSVFGEQLSLRDGSVTFKVIDGELAGKGPPIQIIRTFRLRESNRFNEVSGTTLAGWMLEVPRLKTITNYTSGSELSSSYGWQVPGSDKNLRCTNFSDPGDITPGPQRIWAPYEWWSGYQLVDAAGNEEQVLRVGDSYPQVVGFKAVTKSNWRFSCLSSTSNGEPGEGFLGVSPDGTKYWFNHLVYTSADSMKKPIGSAPLFRSGSAANKNTATDSGKEPAPSFAPAFDVIARRYAMLQVTRIEDRFGNWLTYQYSGSSLTRIDASDGRYLQISGSSPVSVTLGGPSQSRTWTYLDGSPSVVTLPDGSKWSYSFSSLTAAVIPTTSGYITSNCSQSTVDSGATIQASAVSPSGASGSFTFTLKRFGRSYTIKECVDPDGDGEGFTTFPVNWYGYALTQKSISGPGLSTQTWNYSYSAPNASWSNECSSGCPTEVWADVVSPSGVRHRSVFSNRFGETENLLLREETYTASNSLIQSQVHEYATFAAFAASSPYPWPIRLGDDLQSRSNKAISERWTPAKKHVTTLGGRSFTWEVPACSPYPNCFDQFARPTRVVKSGSP